MMSKKVLKIIDPDVAEAALKQLDNEVEINQTDVVDGKVSVYVMQSTANYEGIRAAVAYFYRMAGIKMPMEMTRKFKQYMAGQKRTGLKEKQDLGLEIMEGKKSLSFERCELIAKQMFVSGNKEHIFAHLFLSLDWCLMKRAENCVNAKLNHISFMHDSMVFHFAKSKGHQNGESHVGPWHVYGNPQKPWLCPVLSLARYLFSYPDVLQGDVPLFEGERQYQRYLYIFHVLTEEIGPELKRIGFEPEDLGTHSSRKGVASMVACGCTVSPPISSLCIHAGWVMGGVKDTYIKRENAGDQYVGRCASNLDQLGKEFAISPCYFGYSGLSVVKRLEMKKKVLASMHERISNAAIIPANTLFLAEMAFASICYHFEFLNEKLAP